MQIIESVSALRAALGGCRHTTFVPTMGNLHAGHLSLLGIARENGHPVVASIFINRLQFGAGEDFGRYPRTFERDCAALQAAGCDFVFAPNEHELYPAAQTFRVSTPPGLGDILEGEFRPGFFEGVATIVLKLFGCVQPATAVFGRKDYQQLLIIRNMVSQFDLPIRILAGDIARDADGLAMSSRNGYLDAAERAEAPALYRALNELAQMVQASATQYPAPAPQTADAGPDEPANPALAALQQRACAALRVRGWEPDYLSVRRRSDLAVPSAIDLARPGHLVALGAARLGATRLIDNIEF